MWYLNTRNLLAVLALALIGVLGGVASAVAQEGASPPLSASATPTAAISATPTTTPMATPTIRPTATARVFPSSAESSYYLDRELWLRTPDERRVLTAYDLGNEGSLAALPLQLGEWRGEDVSISNAIILPMLDPDQIVYRAYRRGDRAVTLTMVGSTISESFHHPLVCYEWSSWGAEDRETTRIPIGESEVVLRYIVGQDPNGLLQVDLSGYLWPTPNRRWSDGTTQLRVTGFATESEEQALTDARDFAGHLFARVELPPAAATAPVISTTQD